MIGIVDYNAGNITSVERALKALGIDFILSKKPEDLKDCEKLILRSFFLCGGDFILLRSSGG